MSFPFVVATTSAEIEYPLWENYLEKSINGLIQHNYETYTLLIPIYSRLDRSYENRYLIRYLDEYMKEYSRASDRTLADLVRKIDNELYSKSPYYLRAKIYTLATFSKRSSA